MKGYFVGSGYMGWIGYMNMYMNFATERDYVEFMKCSGDCSGDCENCDSCKKST